MLPSSSLFITLTMLIEILNACFQCLKVNKIQLVTRDQLSGGIGRVNRDKPHHVVTAKSEWREERKGTSGREGGIFIAEGNLNWVLIDKYEFCELSGIK